MTKGLLRNQTYQHQELAEKALRWAANKCTNAGNRGSVEVYIPGYGIADSVIIQAIQTRFRNHYGINESKFGYSNEKYIFVFESKVSRGDFMTLYPKIKNGGNPGNFNYVVAPKEMIKPEELPSGWGLLEPKGNGLTEIVKPHYFSLPSERRLEIESEMLWHHVNRWKHTRIEVLNCPECNAVMEEKTEV